MTTEDHMQATVRKKLEANLKPSHLEIEDFSDGCGLKFRIIIVSEYFIDKTIVAAHKLVYDALKEEMSSVHALAINTYTPAKWAAECGSS